MNSILGCGQIAVLNEHFADALSVLSGGGAFTVWAMGGDAKVCLDMCGKLPSAASLGQLGTCLDDAADRVAHDLLDLDQKVLTDEKDRLAWSASLIGDRSPYAGDLQLNTARYLVVNDIIRAGGRHLFFVESEIVASALVKTARDNGLPVTWQGKAVKQPLRVDVLRARASALKAHWRRMGVMRKRRADHPVPWAQLAACDVVLVDWAGSQTFSPDGATVRTGNLVRMADILRHAGLKVGFIANPLSWTQPFESIADNVVEALDPVVMIEECRSIGSVMRGAWATWRLIRRLKKSQFHAVGHDLSALFNLECVKDNIRPQSTLAYSLVDVAMTLARNGVKPRAIVYPFENQGWERALMQGVRRHLPDTRLLGYQHAPFAARYIGFFPPQSDIAAGRLPDQLVVMGPRFEELFQAFGWPQERLTLGGSLRFEPALENPPPLARCANKTVLAATSIEFGEALDLVVKAGSAVCAIADARLVVNFHPVVTQAFRDEVRDGLVLAVGEEALSRVEFSTARAADLINRADVLLYNSSGAVFDACFAGVPVVHVPVDGCMSYDKVPDMVSRRVAGGADLQNVLTEILDAPHDVVADMNVGGVIAPINENNIVAAVRGA